MNHTETLFENNQVDLSMLPMAEEMQMVPLELAYKKVRYIIASIIALFMIIPSWVFVWIISDELQYIHIPAILVTLIAFWIIIYNGISFHYMSYAMRERDISFKSGWLWKSMTTVPFNRVQHCDIRQGLIDRQFGLSKLTIYTAGGQSADLMIRGLLPDTAERIKAYILHATEEALEEE